MDCVDGDDEDPKICSHGLKRSCPGMLRCHGTSICIPKWEICDGQIHCPHGDDEAHCLLCAPDCVCAFLTMSCFSGSVLTEPLQLKYMQLFYVLVIDNSGEGSMDNLNIISFYTKSLKYVSIHHTNLRGIFADICQAMFYMNLSSNNIQELNSMYISLPSSLVFLDISNNSVIHIEGNVFPNSLQFFYARNNKLALFDSNILIFGIKGIYLEGNKFRMIALKRPMGIPQNMHIIVKVDIKWMSCLVFPGSETCTISSTARTLYMLIPLLCAAVVTVFMKLIALFRKNKIRIKHFNLTYLYMLTYIVDILLISYVGFQCCFLLVHKENYIEAAVNFFSRIRCIAIQTIVLLSCNITIVTDFLLCTYKFLSIKDPFFRIKQNVFSLKTWIICVLIHGILSLRIPENLSEEIKTEGDVTYPFCFKGEYNNLSKVVSLINLTVGTCIAIVNTCLRFLTLLYIFSPRQNQEKYGKYIRMRISSRRKFLLFFKMIVLGILKVGSLSSLLWLQIIPANRNLLNFIMLILFVLSMTMSDVLMLS